jgi:hypothetical protein
MRKSEKRPKTKDKRPKIKETRKSKVPLPGRGWGWVKKI